PDRELPGRTPARGGRLHRRRGDPPDHLAGGVAARGRSPGDGRGGGREVLGVGSRAPRRVCRAAPARRHRRRPRLPPPSLLSLGEADRADARLRHSPARPPGRRAGGAAAGRVVDRRHLGLGLLCVGLAALANLLGGAVVTLRRWDDRFLRYAVALGAGFMLSALIIDRALGLLVFSAIVLHKAPEGFAIASVVLATGGSRRQALLAASAVGTASILGGFSIFGLQTLVGPALGISAGVTLYVAASDLVPEVNREGGTAIALTVFAGVLLYYLTERVLEASGL